MNLHARGKFFFTTGFLLFFTVLSWGKGYAQPVFTRAPLNPAFVEYLQESRIAPLLSHTSEGYGLGLIPPVVDLSHLKGVRLPEDSFRTLLGYPASYDLRALGRLTPVRNQNPYGTCWAFATYSSMESWLLTDESATWDFSENNLANLHGFDSPLGGFIDPNIGGNYFMSTAYLARWNGPVSEADDPYPNPGGSTGSETVLKHVQGVLFLPDRSGSLDNDNIKEAVTQYGAVYTSMYYNGAYYNSTNRTYYYSGGLYSNHGVAIVGWDDNFDKALFNTEPAGNGAFIVRNNWGTGWGDGGYFYISYYDSNIGSSNAVFNSAEPVDDYSAIYQYDPLGIVYPIGAGSNTAWFSNIFTAQASHNVTAVSFYALAVNSAYEVYVYTGVTAGLPRSGTLASTVTGTIPVPGYHTVALTAPAAVSSGQLFSVVVKLTTPGWNYPISIEYPEVGYSSAATANAGESFVSVDDTTWTDMTDVEEDTSVCLKAFAGTGSVEEIPVLNINPAGLDFGLESNSLTFNITNTGTGTLNWSTGTVVYNEGSGWITGVAPGSGSVTTGTDMVTATASRTGLASGVYTATIPVTSNGGSQNVTVSIRKKSPPAKPSNVSPVNGATGVSLTPVLTGSVFSDPDGDVLSIARWRIKKESVIIWNSINTSNSIAVPAGLLTYSTTYGWQVEYVNSYGLPSGWSDETFFATQDKPQRPPNKPVNKSPANLAVGVSLTPTLSASNFSDPDGDTMADSHWRMRTETGAYEIASIWESASAGATTSIVVLPLLETNARYFWQVRYQDSDGIWSLWSEETAFTTVSDGTPADGDEVRDGGSGGGCFIATAAYGTEMAAEVIKLSRFRDRKLLNNIAGRAFVRWYYRHSPPVANYISKKPEAKFLVRAGLRPLLWILGTLTR